MPTVPPKIAQQFRTWREKPQVMVRELFGATPDPWQDKVLAEFPSSPRVAMKASKGPGKTCTEAWLAWNFLLTRPHPNIAATSISGDNLRDNLWKEMATWMQKSDLLKAMFVWQTERIFAKEAPATWFMSARTWAKSSDTTQLGETLAGLHSDYIMFIVDESGSIPTPIMLSAEAALSSCKEGHIVQAGNTNSLEGALYDACVTHKHLWNITLITGDPDNPMRSPRVSLEWAREMISTYGRESPFVKVMVLGEWPTSSINALLGPDDVEAAFDRKYQEHDIAHAARILGVDVARQGDDASVIFPRQGLVAFKPHVMRDATGIQGGGQIARVWDDWDVDACFIDNTGGFGAAWIDILTTLNRSAIPVGFAERAQDRRYANRRAEMYFKAAEWIKAGGALHPETPREIVGELTQTCYTFKGDALILEPKDLIKLKLGRSPDLADGLCFVANTMIRTPTGEAPIQDIRVGDEVITPFGPSTVKRLWVSDTSALTTARFSNGASLIGKGEHKVFVWGKPPVRLDALTLTDTMEPYDWWRLLCWNMLSIAARNSEFKVLVDTIRPTTRQQMSAFFIAACGESISDLFQSAMTSITRMATGGTTTSPTWRLSSAALTVGSTCLNECRNPAGPSEMQSIWPRQEPLRLNGTPLQKVALGTRSTVWRGGLTALAGRLGESARPVDPSSTAPSKAALTTAQAPALRKSVIGVISRAPGSARTAARILWRIAIGRQHVAPTSVRTESVPPTTVYNLTLERHNAYYANGLLVFNCLTFAEPVQRKRTDPMPKRQRETAYDPYADYYR